MNYDEENWKKIISTLNNKEKWTIITDINRAQVIDDSMALAKGNYLSYDIALATTEYLDHEEAYLPWNTALRAFNFIGDRLIGEPDARRQHFQVPKETSIYFRITKNIDLLRACLVMQRAFFIYHTAL